ncbi:hypothetical protein AB1Y20_014158 [Prymnesium parvum]|uniref:Nucleoside phosphorylase domain-containing protein n=1 Tax=Prymnesium parvum TaxID=97485 RepID=A0AB34IDH5_PRYPA
MAYRPDGSPASAEACYRGTNAVPRQGSSARTLHVGVTEGDLAPRILTCGTVERARAVAASFDGGVVEREVASARGFLSLTGRCGGVPVSIVATGMGVAMMDFMLRESVAVLPAAADGGARALVVRFGTCGSIREDAAEGTIAVSSGGSTFIRRDPDAFGGGGGSPYQICSVVPADAELSAAVLRELRAELGEEAAVVEGLNVSACSFYSSQGRRDPAFDDGHEECDPVEAVRRMHPDATSMEMETFHLLDLARCARPTPHAVRATAASIIVAHRPSGRVASAASVALLESRGGAAVLRALAATPLAAPPPSPALPPASPVVTLDYADLAAGKDLSAAIGAAYGYDGLGILAVRGVPGVREAREALLPLAAAFAALPPHVREAHEDAASFYSVGWSHGKEVFGGARDVAKGSFYANPLCDAPFDAAEEGAAAHPSYSRPNLWPREALPQLEPAFKAMGALVVRVGALVAAACDAHVAAARGGAAAAAAVPLRRVVSDPRCVKARLLHYFPRGEAAAAAGGAEGSWCGWHNDHGALTGLVAGMLLDARDGARLGAGGAGGAGLHVTDRRGAVHRVAFGADELGFQIGEAAQILTGGVLQATPHAVRAGGGAHASRESFAVFMQPYWGEVMAVPHGVAPEEAQAQAAIDALPAGVPPLASRWRNEMTFGEFSIKTLEKYH